MFIIKHPFSYLLCLYYLFLTPKVIDYRENLESYIFSVIFLSILHAVGVYYLFHYLGWMEPLIDGFHSLTGYYAGQGIEIAGLLGAWNLLGGLQYPYLNESLIEEENSTDPHKERQAIINKAKAEYRKEAERNWKQLVNLKGPESALAYLKESKARQDRGLDHQSFGGSYTHSDVMRDPKWVKAEIKRLEKQSRSAQKITARIQEKNSQEVKDLVQKEDAQIETKFW